MTEPPPGPPYVEEALSADAVVVEEHGRWIVYLDVVLASGAVRRKVGDHPDRRRAEQAGRIIERNARRHIRPAVLAEDDTRRRPPGADGDDTRRRPPGADEEEDPA